ncbi:Hypothetical Protein FCC1311_043692 [Hondaea fermentalgiana]|uniref:YCII-related domain-containing protein n=1 Tax=Hondaea fermentalgiana TaxID=2315210 RepID=A0A2R5GAU8_9STRA|nr:Hypothetical Protein FCC1311_043692 [Hondaea fermentalgiana]|eukprot:GBG28146.1 Hypothetical Protein FCC1311_043692 [Hondaea fermentalgiana]
MQMAVREKHYLLNYEYVDGMLEKREPYRSDHLARVKEQYEKGVIKTAGAYGAAEGAVLHFECDDKQLVDDFAQGDPYLKNGLITSYKIHEWALVFPEQ